MRIPTTETLLSNSNITSSVFFSSALTPNKKEKIFPSTSGTENLTVYFEATDLKNNINSLNDSCNNSILQESDDFSNNLITEIETEDNKSTYDFFKGQWKNGKLHGLASIRLSFIN